jgi:beta-phosphoglucomutase
MAHTKKYQGFIFDLNGTMINDMPYHIRAWHRILTGLGADLTIDQMKEECYGKNHELLERMFPGRFSDAEKDRMSLEKEKQYQQEFRSELRLIQGLDGFLKAAHDSGIKTAVGSAAIMFNIDFVLDGLNIRQYIDAIVSADDVGKSKPHPETFSKCAEALGLTPKDCLVFEDSPKGAESAANAGMDCIIITTLHEPEEFSGNHIIRFIKDFEDPFIRNLIKWKQNA